ncbi:MAG: TlpA disulfide reductase family protein [bacterium]
MQSRFNLKFYLGAFILLGSYFFTFNCYSIAARPLRKSQKNKQGQLLKVDDLILHFEGKTLTGNTFVLSENIGKKAMAIVFWSIYCKPCDVELKTLNSIQKQYGDNKLQIVAINTDFDLDKKRIEKFLERFEQFEEKIAFTVIVDDEERITNKYNLKYDLSNLPSLFLVNQMGMIKEIVTGFRSEDNGELVEKFDELINGKKRIGSQVKGVENLVDEQRIYIIEDSLGVCGFYDDQGKWIKSFFGATDISEELETVRGMLEKTILKKALKKGLEDIGITLYERPKEEGCLRPYGIQYYEDPILIKDCLSNIIKELNIDRYVKVISTEEKMVKDRLFFSAKLQVYLKDLKTYLLKTDYIMSSEKITFSFINITRLNSRKFIDDLLSNSKYIKSIDFPQCEVYTTASNFAEEVKRLEFSDSKVFIETVSEKNIEVEVW